MNTSQTHRSEKSVHISLSDTLKAFIDHQVSSGHYASPSAYVEQLIQQDQAQRADAEVLHRVNHGTPLPVDAHFEARVEALLEEAEASGAPEVIAPDEWDTIERDAMALLHTRQSA
jgi:Arc/MetJ-type ribon-helix-helix transcriptional regulator